MKKETKPVWWRNSYAHDPKPWLFVWGIGKKEFNLILN
jgi:hypothetical protein